ncbi:MAG: hypothetical protein HY747_06490 [Elusimicrobia bacterium]|nr:hypothetical protein [Elusimicrobiota bacterium]
MPKSDSNDFADLIEALDKHRVEFVIVGAYAVAFHGYARGTKDLDILIRPTPKNISRALRVLDDFGLGSLGLQEADFAPEKVVQLGVAPNRVDFMSELSGVSSEKIWRTRARGEYQGHRASYISLECLLENKKAADRPQDRLDVQKLVDQRRLAEERKRKG